MKYSEIWTTKWIWFSTNLLWGAYSARDEPRSVPCFCQKMNNCLHTEPNEARFTSPVKGGWRMCRAFSAASMKYGLTVVGSVKPSTPAFFKFGLASELSGCSYFIPPPHIWGTCSSTEWLSIIPVSGVLLNNSEREDGPPPWTAMHDGRERRSAKLFIV